MAAESTGSPKPDGMDRTQQAKGPERKEGNKAARASWGAYGTPPSLCSSHAKGSRKGKDAKAFQHAPDLSRLNPLALLLPLCRWNETELHGLGQGPEGFFSTNRSASMPEAAETQVQQKLFSRTLRTACSIKNPA